MIPHSRPCFDHSDREAVWAALEAQYVTHGPRAAALGERMAAWLGRQWGVAVQSGTDALTTALAVLGIGPGSRVVVPAYMCSAPLDALALLGAEPVVVDICRNSLSIDPAAANGCDKIDAVIAPHLFGIQAPLQDLEHSCVVEDCAQTLAGHESAIGTMGRLTICSFYGTKLLATGHGGMVLGDDPALGEAAYALNRHDKQDQWTPHLHGLMSDLNAALGLSQMEKLDAFLAERQQLAQRYCQALRAEVPRSVFSRFLVTVDDMQAAVAEFAAGGVDVKRPVYKPISQLLNLPVADFPNAEWAHRHILSVPLYPGLKASEVERIVSVLERCRHDLCCWPPA